jgi:hypothetical protein
MRLAICIAVLCFFACGNRYTTIGTSLRLNTAKAGGNRCEPRHGPVVRAAWSGLQRHSKTLGLQTRWPPEPVAVCIVDMMPYVVCGVSVLAGCAWPEQVFVASQWAPGPTHDKLQPGYDWRNTLVHELVGALMLQGVLALPRDERTMVADPRYGALTKSIRQEL